MTNSPAQVSADSTRLIYKLAGLAGIVCALLLVAALVMLLARGLEADAPTEGLRGLQSNWLVTLFKLHFGVDGISSGMLRGLVLTDVVILGLTTVVGVGLWSVLKSTTMAWSSVGMALPALGLILYIATQLTGRSAVMVAVLAFATIALWSPGLGCIAPPIGIIAGVLLLVGDLTVSLHLKGIAVLMGIGYVLLAVWFMMIGIRLVQTK